MRYKSQSERYGYLLWVVILSLLFFCCILSLTACAETNVSIDPSSSLISSGDTFTVHVLLSPSQPVKSFECRIGFNPTAFTVLSVSQGDFFRNYTTFFNKGDIDNTYGLITHIYGFILGPGNISTNGTILTLNCKANTPSSDVTSSISLITVGVTNETGYVPILCNNASITIEAEEASSPPSGSSGGGGGGIVPPEEIAEQHAPETPLPPIGQKELYAGEEKTYTVLSWDADDDTLRYMVSWGDDTMSSWSAFVVSNMTVEFSHRWIQPGNYTVVTFAQDEHGLNSSWSEGLSISVFSENNNETDVLSNDIEIESCVYEQNGSILFSLFPCNEMNISKYSVLWAFGDGTQSAELYPTHTYSESGEYLVTVTITDVSGKQIVKTYTIVVSETLAGSASSISEVSENGVGWWLLFVGFISIACIVFVIYSKKLRNN